MDATPLRRYGAAKIPFKVLFRALRLPLIAYLLVLLGMTFIESRIVYPAPRVERSDWQPKGDQEEVQFTSADGTRLHGWFYDHPDPKWVVLYCHGNGEQVADNHELMQLLRERLDAAVFIFDYRGYGKSEGKPFEAGIVADGLAAQRWLSDRTGHTTDRVVVVGRSIGGGVATAIAAEQGAGALILQSTFTRLTDAAAERFPWLPVQLVMRNRYDSLDRLSRYDGPLLISHGTTDEVIPYEHGQQLFESSPSKKKQFLELAGRTHNQPQPMNYYVDLKDFLQSVSKID